MEFQNLLLKREGNISIITLNRPKALNALNYDTLKDLDNVVDFLAEDDNTYVVIITGAEKAFVAGADITEMKDMDSEKGREFGKFGAKVFRKIESLEKPVIAAVNGFALGGGCELALSCDIRIASEKAKFGQPEVGLGITPGFSGTQRMARIVGISKAKELIYTGNMIDANEAIDIGLVNKVVSKDELMDSAMNMAKKIASNGQLAVKYSKIAINKGIETDMETAMEIENNVFGLCFATEDQREGMEAFVEKRKPNFKNK
ncbi:short-chain-enoyl-CoA hydratase [Dethiothermospora halolimnae]|uniref:short-chain-enoyl-CoA hydratase n=1 Tax=Dethiothermospora halolimnae TaxID=3114390 RepID=UPI003CCBC6D5